MKIPFKIMGAMAALVGIGVLAIVIQVDRATNYTKVNGQITDLATDCYVKSGKTRIAEKDGGGLAYMDCDLAPLAAVRFNMSEKDVKKRTKITYSYNSPLDNKSYTDSYTDEPSFQEFKVGEVYTVLASKKKPDLSKWDYGKPAQTNAAPPAIASTNTSAVKGLRGKL
jgi:hypothetical protein